MTPLNSIRALASLSVVFLAILAAGCGNPNDLNCKNCQDAQTLTSDVNFKITDKTTNEDLFFGKQPKFNVSQIKMRHVTHGVADSVLMPIKVDIGNRLLSMNFLYNNDADTVLLQIGDSPRDTLFLATGITMQCCPHVYVASALLNKTIIYNTFNGTKTASVKSNIMVIPH